MMCSIAATLSILALEACVSVSGRESAVEFEMTLVDSSDGLTFGSVAIPFQSIGGPAR